jgi:iron(III) transport system substrate-binding protein
MKHSPKGAAMGILCLVLLFVGISYSAEIPAIRDAKDSAERARVQALIDGARKENKLDWRGGFIYPEHSEQIIAGFKEYYGLPQLKCNYTYEIGVKIIALVEQLFNAKRTPPDMISLVAWDWFTELMKRGKLMRYESPYYKEYTLSHKAGLSNPGYWVSDSYTSNPIWNVTELEKKGIKNFNPTSWWDFLDPQLVQLTCMSNLATSSSGIPWAIGLRKKVGDEWFIKLGKGKPALYQQATQGETWVGSGEYPIGLTSRNRNARNLEEGGVKMRWLYPKEGLVLFPLSLVILADAPNPNTAKLLVDYMRSGPGVQRTAEILGPGSLIFGRPGIKISEKARQYDVPAEEINVIQTDWNKDVTPEAINAFKVWAKKIGVGY